MNSALNTRLDTETLDAVCGGGAKSATAMAVGFGIEAAALGTLVGGPVGAVVGGVVGGIGGAVLGYFTDDPAPSKGSNGAIHGPRIQHQPR